MAVDQAFYLVPKSIARRAGVLGKRYRTKDNKYILDQKDLSRVKFTTEEFVEGLNIEKLTTKKAKSLIAKNGYKRDISAIGDIQPVTKTQETAEEETSETYTEAAETTEESETTKTEE